ncbi:MAG: ABC transporter ATP-binding protein [Desulfobacterales bacterium]|nr:ABC transporter ATP-binding protein [Desulfobacterales bacterium]
MEIRSENIEKKYGKTMALKGISFKLNSNQIFGFVGPNGAGKTTTLRILATLDEPTSGDGYINGISITQYPEKVRGILGFVPDTLPTHNDITVHEYLDFFARAYGLKGQKRRQSTEGVEEFTGLIGIRDKMLKALSKGMKQRVSLARALIHDPAVLLMDEPAAGLDPRARVELRELLKILSGQGKAILISSHILTELTEICNGAIIIEHGNILRTGTIEELVKKDRPHITLLVRSYDRQDQLFKTLLETPKIAEARRAGKDILVELEGGEEDVCDLLSDLVQQGHRISEFKQQQTDLEDIFMSVTNGELQ